MMDETTRKYRDLSTIYLEGSLAPQDYLPQVMHNPVISKMQAGMEVSTLQFPFPLVNLRYTLHEVLLSEVPVSVCNFLS